MILGQFQAELKQGEVKLVCQLCNGKNQYIVSINNLFQVDTKAPRVGKLAELLKNFYPKKIKKENKL